MKGLTPMMQQYFAIKEHHKDHILFYRLGDFYEMFFDDALLASKELELTLTGRDCGMKERAPMCGVPYHSAESYIAKLIQKGYKVAVCEQTEDPAMAKGIVSREVVRVITPGTLMENNLLDEGSNNFLCSIYSSPQGYGLAFADISTGEVQLVETEYAEEAVINELTRYFPREIIFNAEFVDKTKITTYIRDKLHCTADLLDDEIFDIQAASQLICKHFSVNYLEDLNLENSPSTNALGALLFYLGETQKTGLERLVNLLILKGNRYMNLNDTTRVNLELIKTLRTQEKRGSLLWVVDHTKTPMGKRQLRNVIYQPLVNPLEIEKRLNAVEELYNKELLAQDLSSQLSGIFDIERLLTRIVYGNASPREYKTLEQTLSYLPNIKDLLSNVQSEYLKKIYKDIDPLHDLSSYLNLAICEDPPAVLRDGNVMRSGFSSQLDEYRDLISHSREHLSKLEESEKKKTGIKNLKIAYNRVFGYYIEVTRSNLNMVPEHYIRKQTLANAERYITEELKELEEKISRSNELAVALEIELFEQVRQSITQNIHRIQQTATAISWLDVYLSFAEISRNNHYVRPTIELSNRLEIQEGRHPVVEQMLQDHPFVPNDTILNNTDTQIAIITGPNMAGKSTYMRQTALIVIMAQMGCFVPATTAIIGIVDGIYTRIGASDDLTSGDSTFMVEMKEVADILKQATSQSLLILDEIGRGTSTYDGMSIARAVIEYIADSKKLGAKTLFATHYHELTEMEEQIEGVKNFHIAAKKRDGDIIFLRRIVRGGTDDSYGIEVSKLAGVPTWVINRAYSILEELEHPVNQSNTRTAQVTDMQICFDTSNPNFEIIESLEQMDIETLTPLEALNMLYGFKKLLTIKE